MVCFLNKVKCGIEGVVFCYQGYKLRSTDAKSLLRLSFAWEFDSHFLTV